MKLILLGLNHETAPLALRESLAVEPEQAHGRLRALTAQPGVREALLISTCNRVEVLATIDQDQTDIPALAVCLADGRPVDRQTLQACLYVHENEQAVHHLFRVAASLDSLVLGEPQILGQIKDAFRLAAQAGASRAIINRLMHKAIQVAKKVRTETKIGSAAVSVSYAAVQLARKIFDDLEDLEVMLLGAGEMAELAARHLKAQGIHKITIINRSLERGQELAARLGGQAHELTHLPKALAQADIVISSAGGTEPLIWAETVKSALRARRGRPLFFIDIAVPRNVDPAVGQLDGCYVYDMDDLGQVVEHNRQSRASEAARAEEIVAAEVNKFSQWLKSLEVIPTVARLAAKAEDLRLAELKRSEKELKDLTPDQRQALERLTRSLVKKMLHDPIDFLKHQSHRSPETQQNHLALLQRLFKVED